MKKLVLNVWRGLSKMKSTPLWFEKKWKGDLLPSGTLVELGIPLEVWPGSISRGVIWGHQAFPMRGTSQSDTVHMYLGLNRALMNELADNPESLEAFSDHLKEAGWTARNEPTPFEH